ncbi:hypothetical protein SLS62_002344 [Diatrype stigma]|uniref:Zn(2)-C6 fungal-type domain-containing protein n=1 Tax=Diatrype stigma TaxID=117547 RepID=A0AAN9UY55_9PEZI
MASGEVDLSNLLPPRKRRCDGGLPKCAHCTSHGVECKYAAQRRTRGPGKRHGLARDDHDPENLLLAGLSEREQQHHVKGRKGHHPAGPTEQPLPSSRPRLASDSYGIVATEDPLNPPTSTLAPAPTTTTTTSPPAQPTAETQAHSRRQHPLSPSTIFPHFLLQGEFDLRLRHTKKRVEEAAAAGTFAELMPSFITRRLIENAFEDDGGIMKPAFLTLLDAQYAASTANPAGNPARWAVVNAVVALAIRAKTAPSFSPFPSSSSPESEAAISSIAHGYYRNAAMVIPSLVLGEASLLSIRALVAMALFARDAVSEASTVLLLASNASRQLDLLIALRSTRRSEEESGEAGEEGAKVGGEECVRLKEIVEMIGVANGNQELWKVSD